jgi:hypothetical protein
VDIVILIYSIAENGEKYKGNGLYPQPKNGKI